MRANEEEQDLSRGLGGPVVQMEQVWIDYAWKIESVKESGECGGRFRFVINF